MKPWNIVGLFISIPLIIIFWPLGLIVLIATVIYPKYKTSKKEFEREREKGDQQ